MRKSQSSKVFSFSEFAKIAARHESDFSDFGTVVTQGQGEGNTYTFKDNGCEVLGVAHLDTVQQGSESSLIKVHGQPILLCPRLDDRLGVYIITRMLPRLGVECDWLLTTGEEVGCSSAENFLTEKQYKWAFSFDRSGDDVVLYQHDFKRLRRLMRKAGFTVGQGSFSDISMLDIGCSGINFGCGYYDPHGQHAFARLNETFRMVDLFKAFHEKHKGQALPFNEQSRYDTMTSWRRGRYVYTGNSCNAYTGYSGGPAYVTDDVAGYPQNERIWCNRRGRFLAWYEVEDLPDDGLTQQERFEILADEAQRMQDEEPPRGRDNGK